MTSRNMKRTYALAMIALGLAGLVSAIMYEEVPTHGKSGINSERKHADSNMQEIVEMNYRNSKKFEITGSQVNEKSIVWIKYLNPVPFSATPTQLTSAFGNSEMLRKTPLGLCILYQAQWYAPDWKQQQFKETFFADEETYSRLSFGSGDYEKYRKWAMDGPKIKIQIIGEFRLGEKGNRAMVVMMREDDEMYKGLNKIAGPFGAKMIDNAWYRDSVNTDFGSKFKSLVDDVLKENHDK